MFTLVCCIVVGLSTLSKDTDSRGTATIQQLHDAAESSVIEGDDGWLFLRSELRFLGAGPFWNEHAAAVSQARKPEWADPEAAIVDFHNQLNQAGIKLLLVPVPAKATIMAKHLPVNSSTDNDADLQRFLQRLRGAGIEVLDLKPEFTQLTASGTPAYLQTDTHWSPEGMSVSADAIAAWITDHGLATPSREPRAAETQNVALRGDLVQMRDGSKGPPSETVIVAAPSLEGPASDRNSPIVLLGDSHALVFSAGGDMHAQDAGLTDHIAAQIDGSVDRVAVRGSGATATRIELLRRRDQLAGKKAVIWLFAARDFTESDGWRLVPVMGRPTDPVGAGSP